MTQRQRKRFGFISLVGAGMCFSLAGPVHGVAMTFFGEDLGLGEATPLPSFPNSTAAQANFLSNVIGVGVEDLNSFANGTPAPLAVNFGAAGTATLNGSGAINAVPAGQTNGVGRYGTSPPNYWESTQTFSIAFSQPVAAFGFFGIDIGDFNGQITLDITDVGGGVTQVIVPNSVNIAGGSVLFFGIIETDPGLLFTNIAFGNTAAGTDFFGFDDFTIASLEQVAAFGLDIKPGSCPNSFNRKSNGVVPVALVGSESFDPTQVDISSLLIARVDGVGGSVAPNEGPPGPHTVVGDVTAPFSGETCECDELDPDGIPDLTMKFRSNDVVDTLQLNGLPSGALVELVVSGTFLDGTEFSASDCLRLVPPGSQPGMVAVSSNVPGVFIDATPLDNQLDGGGFGAFERTYPVGTIVTLTAPATHEGGEFLGWTINGPDLGGEVTVDPHRAFAQMNGQLIPLSITLEVLGGQIVTPVYAIPRMRSFEN